jgi:hypothetical protein
MSNETNSGINVGEAMDVVRRTAEAIINNPDSLNINNYKDAFEILAVGCPEKFTDEFKTGVLNRLGVRE